MNHTTIKPIALVFFIIFQPLSIHAETHPDITTNRIYVPAVAHPSRFQGSLLTEMPGYHLLVWEKGNAAKNALFTTEMPDSVFYQKLLQLGATPGNALSIDVWEQRKNPDHSAVDKRIEGDAVEISIHWDDLENARSLNDLLKDTGGKGFDFRFGGHLQNQSIWHSGCNICLFSCPGSKIGNAAYTVRDYVQDKTQFRLRDDHSLKEGTKVTFIFHLKQPQEKK